MLLQIKPSLTSGGGLLKAGILGAAAVAISTAAHPAQAASLFATVEGAVTCAVTGTGACTSATNSSSGSAFSGTSNGGSAVRGTSKSNYGLYGISTSGNAGVAGTTGNKYGVYGFTTGSSGSSSGVYGSSTNGYGVEGKTSNGSAGVFGSSSIVGVLGQASGGGNGVQAVSAQGTGVYGTTTSGNGNGVFGFESGGGPGIFGESGKGAGIFGMSYGGTQPAVYGENEAGGYGGLFYSSYEAIVGQSNSFPLLLKNGSGSTVFWVDGSGNVNYRGGLYQYARMQRGLSTRAFTAKITQPTVEDTGSAQLVGGAAAVRLDPTFAASIEQTVAYRVFITPDGDTPHGLFVASKSPAGFIVREAQGGRSTVAFDYRIVATALGQAGQHMSATTSVAAPADGRITVARPVAPHVGLIPQTP